MSDPQAERFVGLLDQNQWTLAAAESCTGGLLASTITSVPGASRVFLGGFIAYSNEMKVDMLDIPESVLSDHGAVSRETAELMAVSAKERTGASIGISTTGAAGPDGLEGKPPGTVFIALAYGGERLSKELSLAGSRDEIRSKAVGEILSIALEVLPGQSI